jgi:hypothetical protein
VRTAPSHFSFGISTGIGILSFELIRKINFVCYGVCGVAAHPITQQ